MKRWRTVHSRQRARQRYGRHVITRSNLKTWAQRGATWAEISVDIEQMLDEIPASFARQLRPNDLRNRGMFQ